MSYINSLNQLRSLTETIRESAKSGQATKATETRSVVQRPLKEPEVDIEKEDTRKDSVDMLASYMAAFVTAGEEERVNSERNTSDALVEITEGEPKGKVGAANVRPVTRPGTPAGDFGDRELLARTLQAEAGGESFEGMLATGAVMANRVKAKGYGDTFREVILAPGQFSAWNLATGYAGGEGGINMDTIKPSKKAYEIADMILSGEYDSPVGNATHYYNPDVATPKWGKEAGGDWTTIGNHIFGYAN